MHTYACAIFNSLTLAIDRTKQEKDAPIVDLSAALELPVALGEEPRAEHGRDERVQQGEPQERIDERREVLGEAREVERARERSGELLEESVRLRQQAGHDGGW